MGKHVYSFKGLSCAQCAEKIKNQISRIAGVDSVELNLATGKLTVTAAIEDGELKRIVQKTVNQFEPGASLVEGGSDKHAKNDYKGWLLLFVSSALFVLSFLPVPAEVSQALLFFSVLVSGYDTIVSGLRSLFKLQMDENTLMGIAVIAAFAIGESVEGAAVMLFFKLGEIFEESAGNKSRKEIEKLSNIRPEHAYLRTPEGAVKVDAKDVKAGSEILIRPYDRIPLDGVVVSGSSTLDTSAITGESMPREAVNGTKVLSGMLNGQGTLVVRTTAEYANSAATIILEMVEQAAERKGNAQKFITRFARYYTPIVTLLAVLLAVVPTLIMGDFKTWLYRALVFLVASCPCALVLSVPLAFFAGIGGASSKGILIKGGRYLEALAKSKAVVFDKTGTLTIGKLSVAKINCAEGFNANEVLKLAATAEAGSSHPIAEAILRAYGKTPPEVEYKEEAGFGVSFTLNGKTVRCGSARFMQKYNIDTSRLPRANVFVAVDTLAVGSIELTDSLRPEAEKVIEKLKSEHGQKVYILSGDGHEQTESAAKKTNADGFYAELLPGQKVEMLDKIRQEASPVLFVGDGINDSPVLAAADAGIAMGLGTDAAIEAADVILSSNNLEGLIKGMRLAKKTMVVVKANIVFSLFVKAIVLLLAAAGYAPMILAVFADVGVSVITVLNSANLLRSIKKNI
ncbi:MAG TPA: cadmium-translocating P-type ATPase [Clostridiales bacterium]|nr:cadmium-translocating P-type ATPase [Clostridiales bacterium]